jgi:hypothetical protein
VKSVHRKWEKYMREAIQEIYEQLAVERLGMSEKEFSRSWLCMSETYWGYIKSTNSKPSAECLLRLYGRLKKEAAIHEHQLPRAETEIQRHFLKEGFALFSSLTAKAHKAIEEYSLSHITKLK